MEPVAAVLARFEHYAADGEVAREVVSVPAAGRGTGEVQTYVHPVPALVGDEDRWCVSLKAVAPNALTRDSAASAWSSPRCVTRAADATSEPPAYLPWPSIPAAPEGEPIVAHYGVELLNNGRSSLEATRLFLDLADVYDLRGVCYIQEADPGTENDKLFIGIECNNLGAVKAQAKLMPKLNMMVFRQGRDQQGTVSDWIQVSPLIEYAHWDEIPEDPKIGANARLNDPYIHMHRVFPENDHWRFVFKDRYPYTNGYDYRYQVVYFTDDHRIEQWRQSDWVLADMELIQDLADTMQEGVQ